MSKNIDFNNWNIIWSYLPEEENNFINELQENDWRETKKSFKDIIEKSIWEFLNFYESVKLPLNYRWRIAVQKVINKELYPKEFIDEFEKGKKLIHEKYSHSHQKLYTYAINAFDHMQETHPEKLNDYCSLLQIKKTKKAYAEFVLKQLNKALDSNFSNVKLARRYDNKKLTPFESSNHYLEWKSTAFKVTNTAVVNMHKYQTPSSVKTTTVHEAEHLIQFALDWTLEETSNWEIALINAGPIYIYAQEQIKDIFKKSVVQILNATVEKSFTKTIDTWIIQRSIMRKKMKNEWLSWKPAFYFENIIEITPRIRQLQMFVKETYGDDTLTFERLITTDRSINNIMNLFKQRVKEWKMQELFNRANNSFF